MRIYTRAGDLSFKTFTFPDGQPHFQLETYELDFTAATIEMAVKSPADLFTLQLAASTLRQHGYRELNLDVRYLLGARMDRAIASDQPHTLQVVAQTINAMGFNKVRILDVHSEVATRLIRNSNNQLPYKIVEQVIQTVNPDHVVVPDKGARERVEKLVGMLRPLVWCSKVRDMQTGNLTGFKVDSYVDPVLASIGSSGTEIMQSVLIVDDICDGGGTFTGLAKVLREAGAKKVYLYVTHGIFSKGLPLEGIDKVFTTDSYFNPESCSRPGTVPYCFDDARRDGQLVVVPVSMERLSARNGA